MRGGPLRVRHCIIDPLVERLGFTNIEEAPEVQTREGGEDGGFLLVDSAGDSKLRVWTTDFDEDLDAPAKRGAAYRFSHLRIAQRVLLTAGERIGILTNGVQLRILISDPARPDSEVIIPLESAWKRHRDVPDSYRFVLALCQPKGIAAIPELVEKARLQQARVTKDLRLQARHAVEHFVQEVLDHPANTKIISQFADRQELAKALWHEGLVLVYRLLFILKLESTDDPARSFSFASSSLWRNTFSPGVALAGRVRGVLDRGEETGRFLEDALRRLFEMCTKGLDCSELHMRPLGGALFGPEAAPVLDNPELRWGERAVAFLLDQLLWTEPKRGGVTRQRVHYGALDVEDLGRVYEALLELEAGIATEPLCRLRRQKLEVVVPAAQGQKYRAVATVLPVDETEDEASDVEADETEEETAPGGKKTKIEWIEEIPPNRFYLRVGLGRKASGSYYTPHSFVRFLVQETLGPLCAARSPHDDPNPGAILKLKVLDPAMGSGHFLVEACRFLAEKLYESCRLCDERATPKEIQAENALDEVIREEARAEAVKYRQRVLDLPDPNDDIVQYLPSRAPEGIESGISQRRALALCRRLVAVHCLYGVDKNRLAVELAKLSLWIESHGEGLPLTFLDHRLVLGDSLTGPFFEHLLTYPSDGSPLEGLFADGLRDLLAKTLAEALSHVRELEATVGTSLSEMEIKRVAQTRLDSTLSSLRAIADAWVISLTSLNGTGADYSEAVRDALSATAAGSAPPFSALPYELVFPEVFFPSGTFSDRRGFDVVLGNPPWDRMLPADKEFFAAYNFDILNAPTKRERSQIQKDLEKVPEIKSAYEQYIQEFRGTEKILDRTFHWQVAVIEGEQTIGKQDAYRAFMERGAKLLCASGFIGFVVPSAFHANEGATGVRRLYLQEMGLRACFSFENRRKLFEIDSRFKFAVVVAARSGPTSDFPCAFYLHDDEWLFRDEKEGQQQYSLDFVRRTGGVYLNLLELRSSEGFDLAKQCFASGAKLGEYVERFGAAIGRELNMSDDAGHFVPTGRILADGLDPRDPGVAADLLKLGYLPLHEGKTFHQFVDHWEARPRYVLPIEFLSKKEGLLPPASHYRLAFRKISSATNERTLIASMLIGTVLGDSANAERRPDLRPSSSALVLLALANSFVVDWTVRIKAASNVNLFILFEARVPPSDGLEPFWCHGALRLICNHAGYWPLWREQLENEWREEGSRWSWPVLNNEQSRSTVRAALDASISSAFGLTRRQYEYALSTFNHKSHLTAPELCLAAFDEIEQYGIEAFRQKYDPYWDIPLNKSMPEPAIKLSGMAEATVDSTHFVLSSPAAIPKKGRRLK